MIKGLGNVANNYNPMSMYGYIIVLARDNNFVLQDTINTKLFNLIKTEASQHGLKYSFHPNGKQIALLSSGNTIVFANISYERGSTSVLRGRANL